MSKLCRAQTTNRTKCKRSGGKGKPTTKIIIPITCVKGEKNSANEKGVLQRRLSRGALEITQNNNTVRYSN